MNDRHPISPYPIRMPQALRDYLEECAQKGSRSLHAEIIDRLTATVEFDHSALGKNPIGNSAFRNAAQLMEAFHESSKMQREKIRTLQEDMKSTELGRLESRLSAIEKALTSLIEKLDSAGNNQP